MLAVLEDRRTGHIATYEVPDPELRPGGMLVRTAFSAISSGTERTRVETSKKSLVGKAMARPDLVKQVLQHAKSYGIRSAYEKVQSKLDSVEPFGYSCSGTVIAVADDVTGFRVGDRVACAGGGYASHCSINFVPRNLAVKLPENVGLPEASLATIGAIALQGLRQANIALGETVAIIGAGLLGVLAVQMAKAAGCRVIAIDADAVRADRARGFGADLALCTSSSDLEAAVSGFSRYGADAVVITAATSSNEPIELAARIARDRARIVIVGAIGMDVSRDHVYHKELSIHLSRSYGPGRYDSAYEEEGHDYPIGFVRWTEQRNLEAFLDLMASGAVNVEELIKVRYPVHEAKRGYEDLGSSAKYTSLIEYEGAAKSRSLDKAAQALRPVQGKLNIGCIGAGGFAKGIIFPRLKAIKDVELAAVATSGGVSAESAKRSFGFASSRPANDLFAAKELDALFVLSRHDSHAEYVERAVAAGKKVFVEKPLAVDRGQLDKLKSALQTAGKQAPFVMVGFNRRFAPATREMSDFFAGRQEPMLINMRVNAGYLPLSHWAHKDGGRILGEGCHFVDWARSMTRSSIVSVYASSLPDGPRYQQDNVTAVFSFADGSAATLQYFANGNRNVSKEYYEVSCEGKIARLDDFKSLELISGSSKRTGLNGDKGHTAEIEQTVKAMKEGAPSPIPLAELFEVTDATLAIIESISLGQAITLGARLSEWETAAPQSINA
jgi:predicted dehydrogenase